MIIIDYYIAKIDQEVLLMFLNYEPVPKFLLCSMQWFKKGEVHINRIYSHSVLVLILDGILRFTENGKLIELSKGEYYIQRPGLEQKGNIACDCPVYFFIEFDGTFSEQGSGLPIRGMFSITQIYKYIDIYNNNYIPNVSTPFFTNGLLLNILNELSSNKQHKTKNSKMVMDIINYLSDNYTKNISVSDMSHKYSYTEDYIIRAFKNEIGLTPYQYITNLRIEYAQKLLLSTNRTIEAIAIETGYNDVSTFYKNFTKYTGVSPRKWSRQQNKHDN